MRPNLKRLGLYTGAMAAGAAYGFARGYSIAKGIEWPADDTVSTMLPIGLFVGSALMNDSLEQRIAFDTREPKKTSTSFNYIFPATLSLMTMGLGLVAGNIYGNVE